MSKRTRWFAPDLGIKDEPLMKSLIQYRRALDRCQVTQDDEDHVIPANLISSITDDGKQMPILDMDFDHTVVASTTEGHTHLYINVPMSKWRWFLLMCALRYAGVIELGFFVWSVRRGGNFVRTEGTKKSLPEESVKPSYGWFRRLKT